MVVKTPRGSARVCKNEGDNGADEDAGEEDGLGGESGRGSPARPEATAERASPSRMRRSSRVNSCEVAGWSGLGMPGRFSARRFSDGLDIVLHIVLEIAFPPP